MRSCVLLSFLTLCSLSALGQIKFEAGYFITTDGKRSDGEVRILNVDWRDNPKSFEFRPDANGTVSEPDASTIAEMGLSSGSVFRRLQVFMDRSTEDVGRLTKERNPEFASETLYLRLLVNGKARLFQYDEGNLHRFFYTIESSDLRQLVHKRYLTANGEATYNDNFKQQLFNDLKCEGIPKESIEALKYERNDLVKMFVKYNGCIGSTASTYASSQRTEPVIDVTLRPGLTYNSLNIKNVSFGGGGGTANIENVLSFRLGIQVELMLPLGDGSMKVFGEPVYQSFSGKISTGSVTASYASLDLHIGLRKYFNVGSGKLFFNGSFVYGKTLSGSVLIVSSTYNVTSSTFSYAMGVGYKAKRISAEINYGAARDLLKDYSSYQGVYGGSSLILGYTLTKK